LSAVAAQLVAVQLPVWLICFWPPKEEVRTDAKLLGGFLISQASYLPSLKN
jgi:hypothetical protein